MNDPREPARKRSPWREPMVWLVIGLPLASVVAGVGLVIVASRSGSSDSRRPLTETCSPEL